MVGAKIEKDLSTSELQDMSAGGDVNKLEREFEKCKWQRKGN